MTENQKKDPLRILILVAVIAGALLLITVTAWLITGPSGIIQQNALAKEKTRIEAENAAAQADYEENLAAAQRDEESTEITPLIEDDSAEVLQVWTAQLDGSEWTVADKGTGALENIRTESFERSDLMQGGLLLVNAWHALPSDFSDEDMIAVGSTSDFKIQVDNNSIKLFPAAYNALLEAIQGAEAEGQSHYIVREGYRSVAEQTDLFNARMDKLSSRYSGDTLIEKTKTYVNYPGTSDYHTGLSFRMDVWEKGNTVLNNQKFQSESTQGAWLSANCWRYGIIFRFPTEDFPTGWTDKSYKTGVSSQLNLYRYVGKAHAAAMKVMDLCLEEYIEFLIEHPHITISKDGTLMYEVIRIGNAGDYASINAPVFNMATETQASLDNMNGVVLAFSY